jgi:hypothetical protein
MATLCGRYIPPDRFTGRWRARSTLKWPRQPPPTPEMWITFRRLIKRAFCLRHKGALIKYQVALEKHLGAWYDADRHIEYDVYRSKNVICKRQQTQGASIYDKYIEDGKSNFFIQDGIRYQPTHKSHPIEITQHGDRIQACNPYSIVIDQERKSREKGDEEEEETEEAGLQILLSEEKLVACSDGSFDPIDCKAAFNWRIVTPDATSGASLQRVHPSTQTHNI